MIDTESKNGCLDDFPGLNWILGEDGESLSANAGLFEYTGMTREGFMADWRAMIHPDDHNANTEKNGSRTIVEPVRRRLRIRQFDGSYSWFETRSRAQENKACTLRWYISAWETSEESLHQETKFVPESSVSLSEAEPKPRPSEPTIEREQEFHLICDRVPLLLWSFDAEGGTQFHNRQVLAYSGLSGSEINNFGWRNFVHPDDLETMEACWLHSLKTGEPFRHIHRLRRADGIYRWHAASGDAHRDSNGQIARWYGGSFDIDDVKRGEEELQKSETELRTILDTLPGMVWSAGPTGEVEYLSRKVRTYTGSGMEKGSLTEQLIETFHPDERAGVVEAWMDAVQNERAFYYKQRLRAVDGEYRLFEIRADPLRDAKGTVLGWFGINLDIEDSRKLEEALVDTRLKLWRAARAATAAELSASIAHEINQPLASIVFNSQACESWLEAEAPNLPKALLAAERVVRDAHSAAEVIKKLRSLFRHTAPTMLPIAIPKIVEEVLRLLQDQITRSRVRIKIQLEDKFPEILGDHLQLQQVLMNLLLNALEESDVLPFERKQILVSAVTREPNDVLIQVCDRGRGFADPSQIFESFYTTKENGLGMGLAVCRTIMEAHGGKLWASSNDSGGSTFTASLPIHLNAQLSSSS